MHKLDYHQQLSSAGSVTIFRSLVRSVTLDLSAYYYIITLLHAVPLIVTLFYMVLTITISVILSIASSAMSSGHMTH